MIPLILLFAGGNRLAAQDDGGMGAILDWIHRLSGPQFIGFGLTGFLTPSSAENPSVRLRLTTIYRMSIDESEEIDPDDASVSMLTFEPMLEFPLRLPDFDFGVGLSLHRFGGDADGFWHYSVPLQVQWRPRTAGQRLVPRIGIGVNIFPHFDESDFEPLDVRVSRDDAEAVLRLFLALDYRVH